MVDQSPFGINLKTIRRDSKRREGNTWREINRIVDRVTEPETKKEFEQPKKSITKVFYPSFYLKKMYLVDTINL